MAKIVNQNDIADIVESVKNAVTLIDSITNTITNIVQLSQTIRYNVHQFSSTVDVVFGADGNGGIIGKLDLISENVSNKRSSIFGKIAMEKFIRLQLNEIKLIIEAINEISEQASSIDKHAVDVIDEMAKKVVSFIHLVEQFPINPLLAVKLEIARELLLLFRSRIILPIRYLGAYMLRGNNSKNIFFGVATMELLRNVILPSINLSIIEINKIKLTEYIKAYISMLFVGRITVQMFKVMREISKHNYKSSNLYNMTERLLLMNVIFWSLYKIIEGISVVETIMADYLDLFDSLLSITKQMFAVMHEISKHNYKSSNLYNMTERLLLMNVIFWNLYTIIRGVPVIRLLAFAKLNIFVTLLNITKQIFDVMGEINSHHYKVTNLMKWAIKMTLITIIFKLLFEIMNSKSIINTLISSKLKIWDKILTGTEKIFKILHEISKHKYNVKNLFDLNINMLLILGIFKILSMTLWSALIAGIAASLYILVAKPLEIAFNSISNLISILKKIGNKVTPKFMGDMVKILLALSLLGVVAISLNMVALFALPILLGLPAILLFIISLVPIFLAIIGVSLVAAVFTPIALYALPGLLAMTIAVGAIALMAGALKLLEKIDVDREAVLSVVDTVTSVCRSIVMKLFGDEETDRFDVSNSGSWLSLFTQVVTGVPEVIRAIAASAILALSLVSVIIILFIAMALRFMQETLSDLDKPGILQAVSDVIGICRFINSATFGNKEYNESTRSIENTPDGERNIIARFFSGVGEIVSSIFGAGMLVATLVSVGALYFISEVLKSFETFEINEDAVNTTINKIMGSVKTIIAAVRKPAPDNPEDAEKDGWLAKAAKAVLPTSILDGMTAFLSMPMLLYTWIVVGMLKQIVEGLTTLNTLPKLDNIDANVVSIMGKVKNIVSKVKEHGVDIANSDFKRLRRTKRLLRNVKGITEIDLSNSVKFDGQLAAFSTMIDNFKVCMTDHVLKISEIKKSELEDILSNVSYMKRIFTEFSKISQIKMLNDVDWGANNAIIKCLSGIDNIAKRISSTYLGNWKFKKVKTRLTRYADILTLITNMASNHLSEFRGQDLNAHEKFVNNNVKLINAIESTQLHKLKTAVNLFKQMTNFSNSIRGNFEQLAEAVNMKLMPLMVELKELLEGVGQKVEKSGADISASTFAAANPYLSREEQIAQTAREMPNSTIEEQKEVAQRRMVEQMQRQNSELTSKLDELIELFKNGVAQVRMA